MICWCYITILDEFNDITWRVPCAVLHLHCIINDISVNLSKKKNLLSYFFSDLMAILLVVLWGGCCGVWVGSMPFRYEWKLLPWVLVWSAPPQLLGGKRKEIVSGHRLWEIYRGVGCICEKSLANLSGYRLCLRVYRLPDRDCIGVSSISVSDCIGVSAISVNNCIGVMAMSVRVVSALNLPVSIQPFFNN